jgi:hypothetical protein
MRTTNATGKLEYIDIVRRQDGKIHVLGRKEESISSEGTAQKAYHIVLDARTGEIISEEAFIYVGNFPLFMCGCYMLTCEGECPPLLDHELALNIYENRVKADNYDTIVRKFRAANLKERKI